MLPTEETTSRKRISDKTSMTKPATNKEKTQEMIRSFRERSERVTDIKKKGGNLCKVLERRNKLLGKRLTREKNQE